MSLTTPIRYVPITPQTLSGRLPTSTNQHLRFLQVCWSGFAAVLLIGWDLAGARYSSRPYSGNVAMSVSKNVAMSMSKNVAMSVSKQHTMNTRKSDFGAPCPCACSGLADW
jgi:hypothetical protein